MTRNTPSDSPALAAPKRHLLFVVLLAEGAGCVWREYDFREAVKEAKALGWSWEYDDPIDAIQKDWKATFRSATWTEGKRELRIDAKDNDLVRHADIVHRLQPKALSIFRSKFKDLSVIAGLEGLRTFHVSSCADLTNLDALKGLPALRKLDLMGCTQLTNVDAFRGLKGMQTLNLIGCIGLTSVDGLKGLVGLNALDLSACTGLTNVDALKGLSGLQSVTLGFCTRLKNVDALKGLSELREVDLRGCSGLSPKVFDDLRAALWYTKLLY